jgi:hypothetical protein
MPPKQEFFYSGKEIWNLIFSSEMAHVPVRIRKIDFFEVKK